MSHLDVGVRITFSNKKLAADFHKLIDLLENQDRQDTTEIIETWKSKYQVDISTLFEHRSPGFSISCIPGVDAKSFECSISGGVYDTSEFWNAFYETLKSIKKITIKAYEFNDQVFECSLFYYKNSKEQMFNLDQELTDDDPEIVDLIDDGEILNFFDKVLERDKHRKVPQYYIRGEMFDDFEGFMHHVSMVFKGYYDDHDGFDTFDTMMYGGIGNIKPRENVTIYWSLKEKSRDIINSAHLAEITKEIDRVINELENSAESERPSLENMLNYLRKREQEEGDVFKYYIESAEENGHTLIFTS